ncbi:MAG: hypothetical protein U1D29_05045 [Burkholderiales bacterium]|nr:hypothetical protein [Burkholderiales bacterium]
MAFLLWFRLIPTLPHSAQECATGAARIEPHAMTAPSPPPETAPEAGDLPANVPFDEFRTGLPRGRFRVIVNPERARKYVRHRLLVFPVSSLLLGAGTALAMFGWLWFGIPLMAAGFLLHRVVKAQAPQILLHLASHHGSSYREAIDHEIMEVRRAH